MWPFSRKKKKRRENILTAFGIKDEEEKKPEKGEKSDYIERLIRSQVKEGKAQKELLKKYREAKKEGEAAKEKFTKRHKIVTGISEDPDREKKKLIKKFRRDSKKITKKLRKIIKRQFEGKSNDKKLEKFLRGFKEYLEKYFIKEYGFDEIIKKFEEIDWEKDFKLSNVLLEMLPSDRVENCPFCEGEVDDETAKCKKCNKPHYYTMIKEAD